MINVDARLLDFREGRNSIDFCVSFCDQLGLDYNSVKVAFSRLYDDFPYCRVIQVSWISSLNPEEKEQLQHFLQYLETDCRLKIIRAEDVDLLIDQIRKLGKEDLGILLRGIIDII